MCFFISVNRRSCGEGLEFRLGITFLTGMMLWRQVLLPRSWSCDRYHIGLVWYLQRICRERYCGMTSYHMSTITFLYHDHILLAHFFTRSLCLHWTHMEIYLLGLHEDFLYMWDTKSWSGQLRVKFWPNHSALNVEAACSSEGSVSTWQERVVSKSRSFINMCIFR